MPRNYLSRLEHLDYLIRVKATGNPKSLAHKLGISLRTVHEYIGTLKALGAPINYNRVKGTYYYDENGSFCFKFMKSNVD